MDTARASSRTPQPRTRRPRLRPLAGALAALALLAPLAGCGDDGPGEIPGMKKIVPAGEGARVTALLGLPSEIRATASAGTGAGRPVAEGDSIAAGETIETGPKCEAILALADGSTAHLGEAGVLAISKGGAAGVALERGAVGITRPLGIAEPLAVGLGGKSLRVERGRASIALDGGAYSVRIDSGSATLEPGGETLYAGRIARVAADGAAEPPRIAGTPAVLSDYVTPLYGRQTELMAQPAVLRGIGTLTARLPGSGRSNEEALELASHDVDVVLRDGVALTQIEEAFVNRSGRTVEATYRFVLPSSASITRLALDVNGRIEEGEVLERERARRIFREIVEDSVRPRDPALLEWERGSTFSMKIFPIKPGETRRVFLSYVEPSTMRDGVTRYVYPLGGPAGSPTAGRFSIDVDIQNGYGVSSVRTPLYPTEVRADGDRATVSFSAERYAPSVDFAVEYAVARRPSEMRAAAQTEPTGATYAMLLAAPGAGGGGADARKAEDERRLLLVVDTSYGSGDELHALAAGTALELAASLGPRDRVNALACDSGCRSLSQGFEPANLETLERMRGFLEDNQPGGASDLLGAIERAFSFAWDGRPVTIVYIGDGVTTAGETDPGRIVDLLARTAPPNVRVQTIGIGPNVDALLLDAVAAALGGASYDISLGEGPAIAAWNVSRRLWSPGLVNVEVEWPAGVRDAYPRRVGFVPEGSEVAFFAALDRGSVSGDVVLRGTTVDGAPVERRYPISLAAGRPEPGFVSRLHAKAHIDHLQLVGGAPQEIIDTSRRMRVASRLTSWIVLENQRMYDRFNVQRTATGEWDGEAAPFTEVAAAKDAEDADENAVATGDELDDLLAGEGQGAGGGGLGLLGSLSGAGEGKKAGGDAYGAATGRSAGPMAAAPAKPASKAAADSPFAEAESSKSKADERPRESADTAAAAPLAQAAEPGAPAGGVGTGTGYGYSPPSQPIARGGYEDPWRCQRGPVYEIQIVRAQDASARAADQIAALAAAVRARPLSRDAHKKYVGALARVGRNDEALAAADEWRRVDPLDSGALTAYGDGLARSGDRRAALRAYASVAEIDPGRAANHVRLAGAFEALGAFDAAASHWRAAAALDPKGRGDAMVRYFFCLAASRMGALLDVEAGAALGDPSLRKVRGGVLAVLDGARAGVLPEQPTSPARGELVVKLSGVSGYGDLDLAVLDPAGRRISGLWARGATVSGLPDAEGETLAVKGLMNGRYRILVSRTGGPAALAQPAGGTVTIRVRDERQAFSFSLEGGEAVVAEVRYKKLDRPVGCW